MANKTPKDRLIKIHYYSRNVRLAEFTIFLAWVGIMALTALVINIIITQNYNTRNNTGLVIGTLIVLIIANALVFFYYWTLGRERREIKRKNRYIKKNGTKVIGEIISLEETEVRSEDGGKNFTYHYNVQYENPVDNSLIVFQTPSVIPDNMLIKEKDLPLKVVVYVYEKQTFAESLINPPFGEMFLRKFMYYFTGIFGAGTLFGVALLSQVPSTESAPYLIVSLGVSLSAIGLVIIYLIKDRY